ncbi:MAG: hypothetical protein OXI54_03835 [Chloroflexota bacterium]|nr:hypothetical protein [Chloroflexota bacterium]MDE2683262.1 hypothetical protein [Chloroflexota bacterium]
MWPFKRKKILPPTPTPEVVPAGSLLEASVRAAMPHPDIYTHLEGYRPDTLLVHFDQVGTAALAVIWEGEHRVTVSVDFWLPYDKHTKERGHTEQDTSAMQRGRTLSITVPTSAYEQTTGMLTFHHEDGNTYADSPLAEIASSVERLKHNKE